MSSKSLVFASLGVRLLVFPHCGENSSHKDFAYLASHFQRFALAAISPAPFARRSRMNPAAQRLKHSRSGTDLCDSHFILASTRSSRHAHFQHGLRYYPQTFRGRVLSSECTMSIRSLMSLGHKFRQRLYLCFSIHQRRTISARISFMIMRSLLRQWILTKTLLFTMQLEKIRFFVSGFASIAESMFYCFLMAH